MNSRELLEKAAKAIGGHLFIGNVSTGGLAYWLKFNDDLATARVWNPLEDDGDAFRLMVDAGLKLDFAGHYCVAYAGGRMAEMFTEPFVMREEKTVATRRAIVRAAAAMADQ